MTPALIKERIFSKFRKNSQRGKISKQHIDVTSCPITRSQQEVIAAVLENEKITFYHFVVNFEGFLDERSLTEAINKVVERHNALRISLKKNEVGWQQTFLPFQKINIPITDLSFEDEHDKKQIYDKVIVDLAKSPLNFMEGELFRIHLIRHSDTLHKLVVVISHICCDFISLNILNREVITFYQELMTKNSLRIPPLPLSFLDYAVWVENKSISPETKEKSDFWREYLADAEPIHFEKYLKTYESDTDESTAEHGFLTLSTIAKESVENFIIRKKYTSFIIYLTAFVLLLYQKTGKTKFVIATPTSGREKPELQGLIGCFVDLLFLHIKFNKENTIDELLNLVRENFLNTLTNQDEFINYKNFAPKIFKQMKQDLVEVVFSVNKVEHDEIELVGQKIWFEMIETNRVIHDLNLILYEDTDTSLSLEYRKELYPIETIRDLLKGFEKMLLYVIDKTDLQIKEIPTND